MKNEDMKNLENIQPLSEDELEDVTGGVKEIVAATTLAAMAMTGQTVSAFGLAKAMAEENTAHIEEAPAQDAYGMEYMGGDDRLPRSRTRGGHAGAGRR